MERVPVQSSSLASVGYDPDSGTLEVEFHTASVYQYFGVPAEVHQALLDAPSKGRFLDQVIKRTGYPYAKVQRTLLAHGGWH